MHISVRAAELPLRTRLYGQAISPKMQTTMSTEELEWLRRKLIALGEKAFSTQNQPVISLVNFYWSLINDQLQASKPLWREAA